MQSAKSTPLQLLALTLLVLLLHGLVLGGMPSAMALWAQRGEPPVQSTSGGSFVTRTIAAQPLAPQPAPATPRAGAKAPTPAPAKPRNSRTLAPVAEAALAGPGSAAPEAGPALVAPGAGSADEATRPPEPDSTPAPPAPRAPLATATQASAPTPVAAAAPAPVTTPAPAPTPASGAEAQVPSPVALAPSTRLQYDGLGEERGFIKYSGSGELLWLQQGGQYSARLEISAWGFRVRTWTSKGSLGEDGLAPLRFGDKPRGAELATHFQRDKNIISFSANNPDVPLQNGAQDKLSALLQLGAMVAGAPARFAQGSSIHFQAADAHRAEQWTFVVGREELLDLPGGALKGLKLSKAPSVEFDQGIEVWLAPALHYLPIRLRITEANGAFVDLLWRNTQKPDGG